MQRAKFGYLVVHSSLGLYQIFSTKPEALKAMRAAAKRNEQATLHYGSIDALRAKAQAGV